MNLHILFFGPLVSHSGSGRITVDESGIQSTHELRTRLETRFPGLAGASYVMAVNQEISRGDQPLKDDDEVALLPPYSGG